MLSKGYVCQHHILFSFLIDSGGGEDKVLEWKVELDLFKLSHKVAHKYLLYGVLSVSVWPSYTPAH